MLYLKKAISIIAFIFCNGLIMFCQDYSKLESIKSVGTIPSDFYTLSSEKVKSQSQSEIKSSDKRKVSKSKESFLLHSNFVIDELLTSGDVIFNDSLSVFINKVADEVLKNDKELRKNLRFYVVKSPYVNAFSTNQGYIIFNIGLLAQIETEAQLAYIICHEIIHYKNKHAINAKVNYDTQIKKASTTNHDKLLAKSAYSKELEVEADVDALAIYMKSNYDKKVFEGVMDVLKYSYLPYNEMAFDPSYLETENFKFPSSYKMKAVKDIEVDEETADDEDVRTHPSIDKRKSAINKALLKYTISDNGKEYLVGEKYFKSIRNIARHELSLLHMTNKNYGASLYNSYLLLLENPNDVFAQVQTMNALYFITKYKNRSDMSDVVEDSEDIQGESQKIYFLLESMTAEELNVITLAYAWKLNQKLKDDVISKICDDLFLELITKNSMPASSFSFMSFKEIEALKQTVVVPIDTISNSKGLSKYDKIKLKTKTEEIVKLDSSTSIKYVFTQFNNDLEFKSRFEEIESENSAKEKLTQSTAYKEKTRKLNKLDKKKGYALGQSKVIIVDPDYYKIDERKKESIQHIDAEEGQLKSNRIIKNMAEKIDLETYFVNPNEMKTDDVQKFNDLSLLNNWLSERTSHDFNHISMYQREIDELVLRTGTSTATWMGTVSVREKKTKVFAYVLMTVVTYGLLLPVTFKYILTPQQTMIYYCLVYDLTSGDKKFVEYKKTDSKVANYLLKSNAYVSLVQMKKYRENEK